jgi:hypothetical protein
VFGLGFLDQRWRHHVLYAVSAAIGWELAVYANIQAEDPGLVPVAAVIVLLPLAFVNWIAGLVGILFSKVFYVIRLYNECGLCAVCGYDLTGNTTGRCPECGALIRRARDENGAGKVSACGFGNPADWEWEFLRVVAERAPRFDPRLAAVRVDPKGTAIIEHPLCRGLDVSFERDDTDDVQDNARPRRGPRNNSAAERASRPKNGRARRGPLQVVDCIPQRGVRLDEAALRRDLDEAGVGCRLRMGRVLIRVEWPFGCGDEVRSPLERCNEVNQAVDRVLSVLRLLLDHVQRGAT